MYNMHYMHYIKTSVFTVHSTIYPLRRVSSKSSVFAGQKHCLSVDGRPKHRKICVCKSIWISVDVAKSRTESLKLKSVAAQTRRRYGWHSVSDVVHYIFLSDTVQYCRKFSIEQGPASDTVQYGTKLSSMQSSASDRVQYWAKLSIGQCWLSHRVQYQKEFSLRIQLHWNDRDIHPCVYNLFWNCFYVEMKSKQTHSGVFRPWAVVKEATVWQGDTGTVCVCAVV